MMTVYIKLLVAGTDVGPFDLYSDTDAFAVAFETGIPRSSLVAGYLSTLVPDGTTQIKIQSTGDCNSSVIIDISSTPTTTTTTSSTSTSTSTSTTTTTTSMLPEEFMYEVTQCPPSLSNWIIDKTPGSPLIIGDIIEFTIGLDPTHYCGEITGYVFPAIADGNQESIVSRDCNDPVHCTPA